MPENISVNANPTPIQRNKRDVAMELTKLCFSRKNHSEFTIENIKNAYLEFYSMVETIEYVPYENTFNPTVEKLGKDIMEAK